MLWQLRKRALKYIPAWFIKVRLAFLLLRLRKEQVYSSDGALKGRYVDMIIRDYIAFCMFPEAELEILYGEIKKEKDRLFRENQGLVYKVMRRMRVSPDDWDEAYSCAIEGLLYAIDNWDGVHAFSTIAYINIFSQLQDFYARQQRSYYWSVDREIKEGEGDTFEKLYGVEDTMEERVLVHSLLEKLPQEERKIVELVYYEGYSIRDASLVLGVNYKKGARLLKSALEKLKNLAGGMHDKEQELCRLAV